MQGVVCPVGHCQIQWEARTYDDVPARCPRCNARWRYLRIGELPPLDMRPTQSVHRRVEVRVGPLVTCERGRSRSVRVEYRPGPGTYGRWWDTIRSRRPAHSADRADLLMRELCRRYFSQSGQVQTSPWRKEAKR